MLAVSGLSAGYGSFQALFGVSLEVRAGEAVAVIGPNGAGKTTLFNLLNGFIRPDRGAVLFEGRPLVGLKPSAICALGLARTFQVMRPFPRMSVLENLEMGAFARRDRAQIPSDLEHVLTLFPRLRERLRQRAGTLSGGERQSVAIARVAHEPQVVGDP